jgi:REP element-mobilizing transposase RayT
LLDIVAQAFGLPCPHFDAGISHKNQRNPSRSPNSQSVPLYRRHLPHDHPDQADLFLTWHLYGSIPHNRYPPPSALTAGQAFVWMDRFLDQARSGPLWLKRDELASLVVDALHYSQTTLRHFDLHAYVVMANHVHILVTPVVEPRKFMQSVKGYTAREANKLLGRTGEPFWQSESYDHWIRDTREFDKVRRYIEENPVKAGIVPKPEDYRWSSAAPRCGL